MSTHALVIDDEKGYCALLRRVLEQEGFAVTTCQDGTSGSERLLEGGIDLLITDLDMPDVTGLDLTSLARRLSDTLPILLITAQKSMLEGAEVRLQKVQCLLKPFTLDDFRAKIAYLTGRWPNTPPRKEREAIDTQRH